MTTSTPGSDKPVVTPIRRTALQLCVDITGAFQLVLAQFVARLQNDKAFRNGILFSIDPDNSLAINCQPQPEVAQHMHDEIKTLLLTYLERERMEVGDLVEGGAEVVYHDAPINTAVDLPATLKKIANTVRNREGLSCPPDSGSDSASASPSGLVVPG